jgi:hypothetical protein
VGTGFEPAREFLTLKGLANLRLRPLGHPTLLHQDYTKISSLKRISFGSNISYMAPQTSTPQPEKDLFVWMGPVRPFKRKNRDFYVTLIAIAGVVGLVIFLIEGFMPVILIISLILSSLKISNTKLPISVLKSVTN